MLGVTQTITWGLVYYSFSVILPAMGSDLGWSRGEMATALIAGFASTIFMPMGSWLIEQYSWRLSIVIVAIVLAATTIMPHALLPATSAAKTTR